MAADTSQAYVIAILESPKKSHIFQLHDYYTNPHELSASSHPSSSAVRRDIGLSRSCINTSNCEIPILVRHNYKVTLNVTIHENVADT
jgi:hypothetical protein